MNFSCAANSAEAAAGILGPEITIVYPPVVDWYLLYQRPQQLLTSFAKIENVRSIFISNEMFKPLDKPVTEVKKDLFVVKHTADYEKLVKGRKVLWLSYPPYYTYAEKGAFDLVVFDAIDNPVGEFSHWAGNLGNALKYADIISCTTNYLYDYHKNSGKPVFLCPNGADYEHFKVARKRLPRPGDLPLLDKNEKLIGFYGALASWIDFELISKIAEKYKVVLIGKNKYYNRGISHPNVTILEHKDYRELPFYLSHFDLALIPFKLDELTAGCDPIKFYEYISAGKPVLATELDELKRNFSDIAYFVNCDNCHEVIARAIAEDSLVLQEERMEVARQNSWDTRAKKAINMIRKHLAK